MCCSYGVSLIDKVNNLVFRRYEVLCQPLNLDLLIFVFQNFKDFVIIEQIVDLSSIDFIHGDGDSEVALIVLPVVNTPLEQVLNCQVLQTLHRERLS